MDSSSNGFHTAKRRTNAGVTVREGEGTQSTRRSKRKTNTSGGEAPGTAVSAITAFDVSANGNGESSSFAAEAFMASQRHSKYRYGALLPIPSAEAANGEAEEIHFCSFRAPSDEHPSRDFILSERGPHNLKAVFQLEHDDPLQSAEDRSAYCRHELVSNHKLLLSEQRDGHHKTETKRMRYSSCDAAAHRLAEQEATWIAHFTPYARPFDVTASGGRCGQKQHYQTTFDIVQPAPTSAMYMSEEDRLPR